MKNVIGEKFIRIVIKVGFSLEISNKKKSNSFKINLKKWDFRRFFISQRKPYFKMIFEFLFQKIFKWY